MRSRGAHSSPQGCRDSELNKCLSGSCWLPPDPWGRIRGVCLAPRQGYSTSEHRGRGAPRENLVSAGLAVVPVPASLIGRSILQIFKKGLFPRRDVCLLFSDVGLRQGSI